MVDVGFKLNSYGMLNTQNYRDQLNPLKDEAKEKDFFLSKESQLIILQWKYLTLTDDEDEFKNYVPAEARVSKAVWCCILSDPGNSCVDTDAKLQSNESFTLTVSVSWKREICCMGNCWSSVQATPNTDLLSHETHGFHYIYIYIY